MSLAAQETSPRTIRIVRPQSPVPIEIPSVPGLRRIARFTPTTKGGSSDTQSVGLKTEPSAHNQREVTQ